MNNSENDAPLPDRLCQLKEQLTTCRVKIDGKLREHESEISACLRASSDSLRALQSAAAASRRSLSEVGSFSRLRLAREVILCSRALEQVKLIRSALGVVGDARRWLLKADLYWDARKFVKAAMALRKADQEIVKSRDDNRVWRYLRESVETMKLKLPQTILYSFVLPQSDTKLRASSISVNQASELMLAIGLYPTHQQLGILINCFEGALLNAICILFEGGVWIGETMQLSSEGTTRTLLTVERQYVNELIAKYKASSNDEPDDESGRSTPKSGSRDSLTSKYNGIWARILILLSDFRTLVSTMKAAETLTHEGLQMLMRWSMIEQIMPLVNVYLLVLCEALTYMSENISITEFNKIVIATGIGLVLMVKKTRLIFKAIDPETTAKIKVPAALKTISLVEHKYLEKLESVIRKQMIPELVEKFRRENWVNPIYDDWLDAVHITDGDSVGQAPATDSDDVEAIILDRYPELAKILRYNTTCYEMFDNARISSFINIVLDLKRVYTPSRYCGEGDALRERGILFKYQSDIIQEILYLANSVIFIPRMRSRIEELAAEILILLLAMTTRTCVSNKVLATVLNPNNPPRNDSAQYIRRLFQLYKRLCLPLIPNPRVRARSENLDLVMHYLDKLIPVYFGSDSQVYACVLKFKDLGKHAELVMSTSAS